jgi:cyclomaltodextrin glucanotransferase
MMESFDPKAPLYQLIRQLADVRKANQAVQYGSQSTQYSSPDVYCFSRRYRDARCFVALNRGTEVALQKVATDLPDGAYRCVISGRKLQVRAGCLDDLRLSACDAVVLEVPGTPVMGQVVVTIQVNGCVVKPGESVGLLGDAPELGSWDQHTPLLLERINESTWQATVVFDASIGSHVAYKYAIFSDDAQAPPLRENRTSRRRLVPKAGFGKWRDQWQE